MSTDERTEDTNEREAPWAPGEWAYNRMEEASERGEKPVWVEVTERFYWQALEVLPPIYARGGFMVSEPNHDNRAGWPTYAAFTQVGAKYYGSYCAVRDFPQWYAALLASLTSRTE